MNIDKQIYDGNVKYFIDNKNVTNYIDQKINQFEMKMFSECQKGEYNIKQQDIINKYWNQSYMIIHELLQYLKDKKSYIDKSHHYGKISFFINPFSYFGKTYQRISFRYQWYKLNKLAKLNHVIYGHGVNNDESFVY